MEQKILPSQGPVEYISSLEMAIEREIKAKFMYETIAKYSVSSHMKTKMNFLAQEEQSHRENLEDLYKKISGKTKDFDTDITLPPEDKAKEIAGMPMADVIRIAIEKEQEAHDFYSGLAENSSDDMEKEMFLYLAEEEMTHKRILEVEMKLYTGAKSKGLERSAEMIPDIYKEWW